jgi:hypothetical protein
MGVFALPESIQASKTDQSSTAIQLVKVVTVTPNQRVVPQTFARAPQSTGCSLTASASAGLLQNGADLNLNQPASCFSLVPGSAVAQSSLAVVVIHSSATIVLPSRNYIAEKGVFVPSPIKQESSLPALGFIALAVVLLEEGKSFKKIVRHSTASFTQSLTLHQLGVLRC